MTIGEIVCSVAGMCAATGADCGRGAGFSVGVLTACCSGVGKSGKTGLGAAAAGVAGGSAAGVAWITGAE
ncbi:MAG: hypothetical protein IJS15_09600 [Victivallales bacterium]|nr:hypothetical protein [Victivallales bacterium]